MLGLCGGYQMLGPARSPTRWAWRVAPGEAAGLGLLEVDTVLAPAKALALRARRETSPRARPVRGYEIHMGRTDGPGRRRPMLRLDAGARTGR